jgi:hypothetical protein
MPAFLFARMFIRRPSFQAACAKRSMSAGPGFGSRLSVSDGYLLPRESVWHFAAEHLVPCNCNVAYDVENRWCKQSACHNFALNGRDS